MDKMLEKSLKYLISFLHKEKVKVRGQKACVNHLFFKMNESKNGNYIFLEYSDGAKKELLASKETEKHLVYITSVIGLEMSFINSDKIIRFYKKSLTTLEVSISRVT